MTATTLTLADFILARVEADEAVARAAVNAGENEWTARSYRVVGVMDGAFGIADASVPTAAHIARYDPARVLAECEAKRAIVEQFRPGRIVLHDSTGVHAQTGEMDDPRGVDILRALASVYADHPDFDPAWSVAAEFAVGE